jgi:hypothetical protein
MKSLKYALCGLWAAVAIQAPALAQFTPNLNGAPAHAGRALATNAIAGPLNVALAQAARIEV